ncbi:EAL domain-containing protein [Butyrivibrio sp. YAB3001]|uniref:EAL domain-containing protein n=1 Tax=Butyrivibrio sp. YAB3001 TaxID=1520812 RepID=UPI0008F62135|nr:EAL domain-containing protein [Butyrivibrio sp. YAB3001]SFC90683.1 EAL domain, c-di-GMP-specific phosphodiesterase class I (or its enzymatically inactive variant) [Butyrivibrio sp. YAB3001]
MADTENLNAFDYVVQNIDEAIKNGWIKIYYQPVIRSITKELCGAESLARWIDPKIGFLPPDKFIGALENTQQIHKLDCYMVECVCRDIHDLMAKNKPVVPVSVNFSRLDFEMLDMVYFVEQLVAKYDIPRDMLHIEITESMIVSDENLMSQVIRDFRSTGYEVWMDDFGSGYSSLTLLKDFDFDLIKMDMRFLSTFTDKSKQILRSAITMAKDLGIRTLAEGVEKQEHFDFLQSIGCARIQGYFYGKPEPLDEFLRHMEEKNIRFEERKWKNFLDIASFAVRDTDSPLEIVIDNGVSFKTLFMNEPFRKNCTMSMKDSYEEIDRRLYNMASPLAKKFREFANILEKSGNREIFYFTANGKYMKFIGRVLTHLDGRYLIKGMVMDVTNLSSDQKEAARIETRIRELNLLYEVVHLINPDTDSITPLVGSFRYVEEDNNHLYDSLRYGLSTFTLDYVAPDQRNQFKEFFDFNTLRNRIEENKVGYIEEAFKIKQTDGTYEWREIVVMMLTGMGAGEYLFCIKTLPDGLTPGHNVSNDVNSILGLQKIYHNIWENLVWNSSIKFFLKDKNRRFKEVSQAFLDFYGIRSRDDIIGKTDEEMQWHVDDDYNNTEKAIINKGLRVKDAAGQCIVNGVVHNIMCNKMPLYDEGKIIGLVGYFIDSEDELARVNKTKGPSKVDEITNLMNARGCLDAMIGYAIQFNDFGKNYGIIMLCNMNQKRIINTYGKETADKVLFEIGKKIIEVTKQGCAVARPKNAVFAIMTQIEDRKELHNLADFISANVGSIQKANGNSVTLKIKRVFRLRTDPGTTDENIYQSVLEELGDTDV